MKSHTSLVAQQTRLSEWADLIRDCQNRPQGMKIDKWCPSSAVHPVNVASEHKIAAVIRGRNHLTLEITEQASASFLKTLLGVISNAQ